MQNTPDSRLRSRILKSVRKGLSQSFSELETYLSSDGDKQLLNHQLECICLLLSDEAELQNERRMLSRQIGPAKRRNEDCSEMIRKVSEVSSSIDKIKQKIEKQLSKTVELVGEEDQLLEQSEGLIPQHLCFHKHCSDLGDQIDSKNELSVSHTEQLNWNEWQSFVEKNPRSNIYHDARWGGVIKDNFNHKFYYLTCRDQSGMLVGVLPLCHLESWLFGSFTVSIPYFNYGGPLADSASAENALMSYAADFSAMVGCSHMEVRDVRSRDNWMSSQRKVSMILPLPGSDHELDVRLGSKVRAQIKKAESHGLECCFGGLEYIDHFYEVFSRNMRDLGTPVYNKTLFLDIVKKFPDTAFVAVVYLDGIPLAAGFLLGYRDKLEIPWAASLRSANHIGSNMFMYRSIIKQAIALKYSFFDFGRSTKNSSTYNFKKQWGAVEYLLHWHYWTRVEGGMPQLNPDNPKYKIAIKVWKKLPVSVTRIIGPVLSRNLP